MAGKLADYMETVGRRSLIIEARSHLVVMLVSALEVYFKRTTYILIQGRWVVDIEKYKEFDVYGQNFQNLESINKIYNDLLGCSNFIEIIGSYETSDENGSRSSLRSHYPEFEKDLTTLLYNRHLLVHHDFEDRNISKKSLLDWIDLTNILIKSVDAYLTEITDGWTEKNT